jgi:hypothetical protein
MSRDQRLGPVVSPSGSQFVENDRPDIAGLVPGAELKQRGAARVAGIELNPRPGSVCADIRWFDATSLTPGWATEDVLSPRTIAA